MVFLSSCFTSRAFGQEDSTAALKTYYWLTCSIGVSKSNFDNRFSTGISANLSAFFQYGSQVFGVRYAGHLELNSLLSAKPVDGLGEISLLYGTSAEWSHGFVSLAAGLGYVEGIRRGKYLYTEPGLFGGNVHEEIRYKTVGIPVDVQLSWTPFPVIGFGVNGFALLNTQRPLAGAAFCIQIGKLRIVKK